MRVKILGLSQGFFAALGFDNFYRCKIIVAYSAVTISSASCVDVLLRPADLIQSWGLVDRALVILRQGTAKI